MSDSDLQITISADASGVGQGAEQAKAAIAGLAGALSGVQSTFAGFGATVAKACAPRDNLGGQDLLNFLVAVLGRKFPMCSYLPWLASYLS
jgi:hypothetical protein